MFLLHLLQEKDLSSLPLLQVTLSAVGSPTNFHRALKILPRSDLQTLRLYIAAHSEGGEFIKRFDSVAPLKPHPSVMLLLFPCRPAAPLTPRRSDREETMQIGHVGQRLQTHNGCDTEGVQVWLPSCRFHVLLAFQFTSLNTEDVNIPDAVVSSEVLFVEV